MPARATGTAIGLVGLGFLAFYLVVRLAFMAQLDAAIEQTGARSVGEVLANLSPAVVTWVVWGYSFRLGMLLLIVGGALYSGTSARRLGLLAAGAVAYLATCYLPFVDYSPPYYGVLGTAILVVFVLMVRDWARRRERLSGSARIAIDLRMAGHFFLVVATWSLCGIFGIVTYALQPDEMLARGLQPTAVMLTSHVMAELTLGWFLLFLAARKEPLPPAA